MTKEKSVTFGELMQALEIILKTINSSPWVRANEKYEIVHKEYPDLKTTKVKSFDDFNKSEATNV